VREFDGYLRANAGRIPNYGGASRRMPPRRQSRSACASSAAMLIP
jgi:hypothetical protein